MKWIKQIFTGLIEVFYYDLLDIKRKPAGTKKQVKTPSPENERFLMLFLLVLVFILLLIIRFEALF